METVVVFILMCVMVQVFMSYDGGATPASIEVLKAKMDLTEKEIATLGSLDRIGMVATSVLWGMALQRVSAKVLLLSCMFANVLFTLIYGMALSKWVMYGAKLVLGATQGLQCVWSTCWIFIWAPADSRYTWVSIASAASAGGNGIGILVAGFTARRYGFPVAFDLQAGILLALWVILLFTPAKQLAVDAPESDTEDRSGDRKSLAFSAPATGTFAQTQTFAFQESTKVYARSFHAPLRVSGSEQPQASVWQDLRTLLTNTMWVTTTLSISFSFFVMSGMQFYGVRLIPEVFGPSDFWASLILLLVTGGGGALGLVVGPGLLQKCGDVESPVVRRRILRLILLILFVGALGLAGGLAGLIMGVRCKRGGDNHPVSCCLGFWLWGCGCALVAASLNAVIPGLTGVNLTCLPHELRNIGSGWTITMQNLLGYVLGCQLPAVIMDIMTWQAPSMQKNPGAVMAIGFAVVIQGLEVTMLFSLAAYVASLKSSTETQPSSLEMERRMSSSSSILDSWAQ